VKLDFELIISATISFVPSLALFKFIFDSIGLSFKKKFTEDSPSLIASFNESLMLEFLVRISSLESTIIL
jgi:hypothetical protein